MSVSVMRRSKASLPSTPATPPRNPATPHITIHPQPQRAASSTATPRIADSATAQSYHTKGPSCVKADAACGESQQDPPSEGQPDRDETALNRAANGEYDRIPPKYTTGQKNPDPTPATSVWSI